MLSEMNLDSNFIIHCLFSNIFWRVKKHRDYRETRPPYAQNISHPVFSREFSKGKTNSHKKSTVTIWLQENNNSLWRGDLKKVRYALWSIASTALSTSYMDKISTWSLTTAREFPLSYKEIK